MTSSHDGAANAAGLPPVAVRRLAELGRAGAFTSDLSVAEFDVVRSAGFRPVGQVQGSCVYQIGFSGWGWCGAQAGYGSGMFGYPTAVNAGAAANAFAPLVAALRSLRHTAMERARAEAAALGGDGVVGVHVQMQPFPGAINTLEFQAIGTAVRAEGAARPKRPFLSDVSGQDFAKLIHAGWVPVDLVMGVAVEINHDLLFNYGTEVAGYTQLVQRARAAARHDLQGDLFRIGGQAAVVSRMELNIHEQECRALGGGRDHIAEAFVMGTALARFGPGSGRNKPTLAVLGVGQSAIRSRRDAK